MDRNSFEGNTVVGGPSSSVNRKDLSHHLDDFATKSGGTTEPIVNGKHPKVDFLRSDDYSLEERSFFVTIGKSGLIAALQELDTQLQASGRSKILSSKSPTDWIGREVAPGTVGLINHGGLPKILAKPGRYPGFPLRNWWARTWRGTKGLSDTVIQFQGLTAVQVSQNQAAVVSDPQNHIFVIKNSGFVAFAVEGTYSVLSIVDQTHLPGIVKDRVTGAILGWTHEVRMKSKTGHSTEQEYVVALFLNIPASNCAILQRGDDLELLPAGQHFINNPNVTLRGLYTLGENQLEMPTKDIFTRDQVPVSLTIYLKWQLTEPLKLTTHGYNTPYDALRDKTQSILTQIVAHLDYSAMVKQRSLGPDNLEDGSDPSSAFLDALRTRAMDEMHEAALEYGIVLKDLAVIDRQFKGEIASTMDKLTTRALQAQVEAANVDRENSNKVKQEEGALSVARIKAQSRNTQADAEAYAVLAAARAQAQRTKIEGEAKAELLPLSLKAQADAEAYAVLTAAKAQADRIRIESEAQAEATRLTAQAEAEAVRLKAAADAGVVDPFAREMEMRRVEVNKVRAYGNKAVFVPSEGIGAQLGGGMALGMAASMGSVRRNRTEDLVA